MKEANNYALPKEWEIVGGPNTYVGKSATPKNVSSTKGVTGYKGEENVLVSIDKRSDWMGSTVCSVDRSESNGE